MLPHDLLDRFRKQVWRPVPDPAEATLVSHSVSAFSKFSASDIELHYAFSIRPA